MLHRNHIFHYVILVLGLSLFALLLALFNFRPQIQLLIVLGGAIFYSLWGVIHHKLEGRLTKLISIEYLLVALFTVVLVFVAINL